jgi:hypothetical protein
METNTLKSETQFNGMVIGKTELNIEDGEILFEPLGIASLSFEEEEYE